MSSFSKVFKINDRDIDLSIQTGDITKIQADVIINAAHIKLLGGGGADGAIHKAAGGKLLTECLTIPLNNNGNRCEVGEAKLTRAYNLPAKYIIHTVAPSFVGFSSIQNNIRTYINKHPETEIQLSNCYRNCIMLAAEHKSKSIAFPSLGTGGHSFPIELAAPIAIRSVLTTLSTVFINRITFVLFNDIDYDEYFKVFSKIKEK